MTWTSMFLGPASDARPRDTNCATRSDSALRAGSSPDAACLSADSSDGRWDAGLTSAFHARLDGNQDCAQQDHQIHGLSLTILYLFTYTPIWQCLEIGVCRGPPSVTNLCRGPSVTNPCRGPLKSSVVFNRLVAGRVCRRTPRFCCKPWRKKAARACYKLDVFETLPYMYM